MRTGRVFWGALFLAIGTLLLLERFEIIHLHWYAAWRFWPLLLILWGIGALVHNATVKWIAAAASGIALAFLIFGFFNFTWLDFHSHEKGETYDQELVEPYAGTVMKATLAFEAAAGAFVLEDTTEQLVAVSTHSSVGGYRLERSDAGGAADLKLSLQGNRVRWHWGKVDNRAEIRLNTAPVWNIDLDIGAAKVDADLSPYKVERITIDAGAASLWLKLGSESEETRVKIDAGASSIRISVPESAGCEIKIDGALSSKGFRDFEKISSKTYRSNNFEAASKRIYITADAGVSSIKVLRY